MRTEHLNEFVVFARHLNFGTAADELFIAKSTLSTHIAALEKELGVRLGSREDGNALTSEGAVFLEGAKTALDLLSRTNERCRLIHEQRSSNVRFACLAPDPALACRLCSSVKSSLQWVDRSLNEDPFFLFDKDKADIVLLRDFTPFPDLVEQARERNLVSQPSLGIPAVIAAKSTHPLARKRKLTREDLDDTCFMTLDALSFERERTLLKRVIGPDRNIRCTPGTIQSPSNLMMLDMGENLCLLLRPMADLYCANRTDLTLFDTLDDQPLRYPCQLVWRAHASSAVAQTAQEILACLNAPEP